MMDVMRDKICSEARSWIGVPYMHRGRTRNGVDCIGLVVEVYRAVHGMDFGPLVYSNEPTTREVYAQLRGRARRIAEGDVLPGDLVLMSWGDRATHFGIVTEDQVVHVSRIAGKVIAQKRGPIVLRHAVGYYRVNMPGEESVTSSLS